MKDNTPYLLSGRERPNLPSRVSPQRYQFLSLKDAEPNLGVPLTNALPASATWVLTTDSNGNRYFATTILSDSTYTTLKNTSGNYVSVFNTVQGNSGTWQSTYTTLNTNSGTWLTVASASSLYYKSSGGDLFGSMNIFGNVLIYGTLSALSGLEFITTKATTTSSLSIVNIGVGPALYVEQDGFFDIARFVDKEGGIVLNVGNVTPPSPGTAGGIVGIRTDNPNHTLTVVGTFSASSDVYTDGIIVSAGVPLDTIIFNANNATLNSVYSTVSSNSGKWESSYSYLNSISGGLVTFQSLSTTPIVLSAANILGNVNIFGNLFAAGSAFFANTIITTTSALSVINSGPGPALFVAQGKGSGDIASFYDGDNSKEVLHVGNATDTFGNNVDGVIGIMTGAPNKTLTVVGEISSTSFINNLLLDYTQGNIVLGKNTTLVSFGFDNVFIGRDVAINNTFGISNTFVGTQAGNNNTLGNNNVFIGQSAGQTNTVGSGNVVIGWGAGNNLQTGNTNCIVGSYAGSSVTIGTNNIFLGDNTGSSITTGNFNIIIGQGAGSSVDTSRAVVIGPNARASEDFQFVAGSEEFPFINGRYFGDLSFYGKLSGTETRAGLLTSVNEASFLRTVTIGPLSGGTGAPLTVRSNDATLLDRGINLEQFADSSSAAILQLKKARGTIHSPTQVISQDNIGNFSVWGWGTNAGFQNVAGIRATASQNFTGTTLGTELTFYTTRKNSTALSQVNLKLGDDGDVHVINSLSAVSLSAFNGTITLIDNGVKTFEADEFYIKVPAGTTAQRPGAPVNGYVRYNTTISTFEFYSNNAWRTPFLTQNVDVSTSVVAVTNSTLWVDTTSGPITVTLPASPIQGDTIRIFDVAKTFDTNNLTVARNGNLIQGDADNLTVATEGAAFDLIFYSVARGWRIFSI